MNRTRQRVSVLTSGAAIFAMITVMVGGAAQAATTGTTGDLKWTDNGTSVTIDGCASACPASVVIPATIDIGGSVIHDVTTIKNFAFAAKSTLTSITIGSKVTTIGNNAFQSSGLTSITIPDGVTAIGDRAFAGTSSAASLSISESVGSIGSNAFSGSGITSVTFSASAAPAGTMLIGAAAFASASRLSAITIPSSATKIGTGAFQGATSLTQISVDPGNPNFSSDGAGVLFDKLKTTLIAYPLGSTAPTYAMPDSVTSISDNAFNGAAGLNYVTFGPTGNLTTIGNNAFQSSGLTSITIPDGVTTIGNYAFALTSSATTLSISKSVGSIGLAAFSDSGITSVTFSDSGAPAVTMSIGADAFKRASRLSDITIPSSATSIGTDAFWGATSLTQISVDSGNPNYSSDGAGVLFDKPKTTLIAYPPGSTAPTYAMPDSVTSISNTAFYGAAGLNYVTFVPTGNLTTIGVSAFNSAGLISITIPSSVGTLNERAFADILSLTRLEFLGNQPDCSSCYSGVLNGSTNATVYRLATATGWPAISSTYQGRPQAYLLFPPTGLTAVAGTAAATISVTAPSLGPVPDSYDVAAVGDSAKACMITTPATSCTVTGLTPGTAYSFTAVANETALPATSAVSAASNTVTPYAPGPDPAPSSSGSGSPSAPVIAGNSVDTGAAASVPGNASLFIGSSPVAMTVSANSANTGLDMSMGQWEVSIAPAVTATALPLGPQGELRTTQGQTLDISGTSYLRGTTVNIYIMSTPILIGAADVSARGNFTTTVTIPPSMRLGTHTLQIVGVNPGNETSRASVGMTVVSADADASVVTSPIGTQVGFIKKTAKLTKRSVTSLNSLVGQIPTGSTSLRARVLMFIPTSASRYEVKLNKKRQKTVVSALQAAGYAGAIKTKTVKKKSKKSAKANAITIWFSTPEVDQTTT